MPIKALVTIPDRSIETVVDLEPIFDASSDAVLIKTLATSGFRDKEVLRGFLPDLEDTRMLKDLLDYADFSHQNILVALIDDSAHRYLRKNRPEIMRKARTEIDAAVALDDFRTASMLSLRLGEMHRMFAEMGFGLAAMILIGMTVVDNPAIRWLLLGLVTPVLMCCCVASYFSGIHKTAASSYAITNRRKSNERSLGTLRQADEDDIEPTEETD